jgi:hypothetical protein
MLPYMSIRLCLACPGALFLLAACPSDDYHFGPGEESTGGNPPATTSTTVATSDTSTGTAESETSSSTEGTTDPSTSETTDAPTTDPSEGSETGGPSSCGQAGCDPATQYCYESIIDGPSEFSCPPIPPACQDDPTCECIVPLSCRDSLQKCSVVGSSLVKVECVDG